MVTIKLKSENVVFVFIAMVTLTVPLLTANSDGQFLRKESEIIKTDGHHIYTLISAKDNISTSWVLPVNMLFVLLLYMGMSKFRVSKTHSWTWPNETALDVKYYSEWHWSQWDTVRLIQKQKGTFSIGIISQRA